MDVYEVRFSVLRAAIDNHAQVSSDVIRATNGHRLPNPFAFDAVKLDQMANWVMNGTAATPSEPEVLAA